MIFTSFTFRRENKKIHEAIVNDKKRKYLNKRKRGERKKKIFTVFTFENLTVHKAPHIINVFLIRIHKFCFLFIN